MIIMPSVSQHQEHSRHQEKYDLELDRVIAVINRDNPKIVAIQLPDGLKPYADSIVKEIESKTASTPIIWAGSCWGSCDVPDVEKVGADLVIQWGHSEWSY